jgi:prevent-host-death family protein
MIYNMTMLMVNIYEAKAKLSEYIDAVGRGERVVICNRNRPVVELRPVEASRTTERDLAPLFPDWQIPDAAFEPLQGEDLQAWEGAAEADDVPRVAESRPAYSHTVRRHPRKRR